MNYFNYAIMALRFGPAFLMLSFGINQMQNPGKWLEEYAPAWVRKMPMINISMLVHAAINTVLGLVLLSGLFLPTAAWVGLVWMLSILPFAFYRSWKTGMRDVVTAFTLLALALLSS
jgi:uncharacterized membrane protein YphA (DoxX/SURF4 family)